MNKITQTQKVLSRLEQVGYVDNFWAIDNYILRLGAIIHKIRQSGVKIEGAYGKELGRKKKYWKNYYYFNTY